MTRSQGVLLVAAVSVLVGCPGPVNPCTEESCPQGTSCDSQTGACVLDCDTACEADEFCINRECVPRYQSLAILHPAEGGAVGVTARVVAQLALTPGAPRADPTALLVEARGAEDAGVGSGELTLVDAGWYEGNLALSSSHGDVVALRAAYDAWGLASPRVFAVVDEQPPTFVLSWNPPARNTGTVGEHADERDPLLSGAFKRDEQIRVRVESAVEPIDAQSVMLRYGGLTDAGTAGAEWTSVAVQEVPEGTGCTQAYCGEAVIDAWRPQFDLVRGSLPVVVEGTDEAGNVGVADAGVPVTRVRWVFDYGTGFNFRAAPSVGRSGTIYAGAVDSVTGTTGHVTAISPEGVGLWKNELGGVVAAMPVGELDGGDRLFVGANTGSGASAFVRLRGSDGGEISSSTMVGSYEASPALTSIQAVGEASPVETLYAVLNNGGSSEVQVFRPEGQVGSKSDQVALPAAVTYPRNVATSGTQAHLVAQGAFRSYELNAAADNIAERFSRALGLAVNGAALRDAEFVGGGEGSPGVFESIGVRITDGGTVWRTSTLSSRPASVAVADDGELFAGTTSGLARVTPATPSANVLEVGSDEVFASPVLVTDERLYAATMNGKVGLWNRDLTPVWVGTVGAAFEASPNMDCARDGGTVVPGRPPTLYLLDKGGKLYSLVSDEALDTMAQWPRYQRDPKNRGSTTYDLSEFTCP